MKFRIRETRHTRQQSVDIDIQSSEEEFVGLLDIQNSPTTLKPIIEDAWRGIKRGIAPELCEDGVGGTYFIFNEAGDRIGVFKPQDEEPYNINNPKGYRPRANSDVGIKEGILVGEASIRECAAFWLDHDHFAGVPATDLVLCQHSAFYSISMQSKQEDTSSTPSSTWVMDYNNIFTSPQLSPSAKLKIGSFQAFVAHEGDCEDVGISFVSKFPTEEVHKIAQLDIRLMNADRHGGNILYSMTRNKDDSDEYKLTPIDHGFTLPSTLDEAWFEWLYWPQAKEPMSATTLKYIASLDVDTEISMLRQKFGNTIRNEHFRVLRITTLLLQKAAVAGLSFYNIGQIMCRTDLTKPSTLERICEQATNMVNTIDPQNKERAFYEKLTGLMETEFKTLSLESQDDLQFY